MKTRFRTILALGAMTALTASLSACGSNAQQQGAQQASAAPAQPAGWSMEDLASVDPKTLDAGGPLPQAVPMQAADTKGYSPAPSYDYAPQSSGTAYAPPDASYYASNPGSDDYAPLAMASALGGMLGDAPPDYGFAYGGVQPWAWRTGDGYVRYAEPIAGGYRYYYYAPRAERPFLVRDPYYSYGYRGDRLAVIYDRDGRVLDMQRAEREREAAQNYYNRAEQLYRAAQRSRHEGVSAPRWQRQRAQIASEQQQWDDARRQRQAWQQWDAHNEQQLRRDWASEALVRRQAETSFASWQNADFRTPPPRLYTDQQRAADLREVAAIRQHQQAQRDQLAERAAAQRQASQQQQAEAQNLAQQRRRVDLQQQQEQARSRELDAQQAQLQAQHQKQVDLERTLAERQAAASSQQLAAEKKAQLARLAGQRAGQAMQAAQHKAQQATTAAQTARMTQQAAEARVRQAKAVEQQAEQAKAASAREAALAAQQKRLAEQAQKTAERKAQNAMAANQAAKHAQWQAHASATAHKGQPSPTPTPADTGGQSGEKRHHDDRG